MQDWQFIVVASEKGLCYIGSPYQSIEEVNNWALRCYSHYKLIQDDQKLQVYKDQLTSYLLGEAETFQLQIDPIGTRFQQQVWEALAEIPYGETRSYAEIAERINRPRAVRAVGSAIGANPLLMVIPCHRVIGKNGALTGFRAGLEMKAKLLKLEQAM